MASVHIISGLREGAHHHPCASKAVNSPIWEFSDTKIEYLGWGIVIRDAGWHHEEDLQIARP
jgi:hypothetical protein